MNEETFSPVNRVTFLAENELLLAWIVVVNYYKVGANLFPHCHRKRRNTRKILIEMTRSVEIGLN